jgi:hypothetical protein
MKKGAWSGVCGLVRGDWERIFYREGAKSRSREVRRRGEGGDWGGELGKRWGTVVVD